MIQLGSMQFDPNALIPLPGEAIQRHPRTGKPAGMPILEDGVFLVGVIESPSSTDYGVCHSYNDLLMWWDMAKKRRAVLAWYILDASSLREVPGRYISTDDYETSNQGQGRRLLSFATGLVFLASVIVALVSENVVTVGFMAGAYVVHYVLTMTLFITDVDVNGRRGRPHLVMAAAATLAGVAYAVFGEMNWGLGLVMALMFLATLLGFYSRRNWAAGQRLPR